MAKIENLSKIVKNELKFQFLEFLRYFNMQYLKRKHFSHRIQIQTRKHDFFEEKLKKIKFFQFFVKIDADHLSSIAYFSKLYQKI